MTHEAKKILASSETDWQRLAPRVGASDAATLEDLPPALSRRHPAGETAERRSADARALSIYVLAEIGGADLVGSAKSSSMPPPSTASNREE